MFSSRTVSSLCFRILICSQSICRPLWAWWLMTRSAPWWVKCLMLSSNLLSFHQNCMPSSSSRVLLPVSSPCIMFCRQVTQVGEDNSWRFSSSCACGNGGVTKCTHMDSHYNQWFFSLKPTYLSSFHSSGNSSGIRLQWLKNGAHSWGCCKSWEEEG